MNGRAYFAFIVALIASENAAYGAESNETFHQLVYERIAAVRPLVAASDQPWRIIAEKEHEMRRRMLLGGPFLLLAAPTSATELWALVLPDEARRENEVGPLLATRGLSRPRDPDTPAAPGAPEILVDQPDAASTLHPPLSFRVRFLPAAGATINTRSFRASYGSFGIDITARILQHARLSERVLSADNMDIPAGSHKVTLTIADSNGREASRTFRFTVA